MNRVDRTSRALSGGWTFLVGLTKRTVVRTSGDPDRLGFAARPPAARHSHVTVYRTRGSEQSE